MKIKAMPKYLQIKKVLSHNMLKNSESDSRLIKN